jgi:hypothetical protein
MTSLAFDDRLAHIERQLERLVAGSDTSTSVPPSPEPR